MEQKQQAIKLRILKDAYFNPSRIHQKAVNKAWRSLYQLRGSAESRRTRFLQLFRAFVRPNLEHRVQECGPYLVTDTEMLEQFCLVRTAREHGV